MIQHRPQLGILVHRIATVAAALGLAAGTLLSIGPAPSTAAGPYAGVTLGLTARMAGLSGPVQVTNAGDGSKRLFIVEQRGLVRIYYNGRILPIPFLDIRARVLAGGEQGLLGLAFHPAFRTNHRFYVYYTERLTGDLIVAEFRASFISPNRTSATTFRQIIRINHRAAANHNGGMLAFGPDGYLYIGTGDGGGAGDTGNHAQSLRSLLGKLLRIDVNGRSPGRAYRIPPTNPYARSPVYRREIWSRGLRNPWRWSFDRATGDLWIGDVGQARYEEVDRALHRAGGGRALNFGWHVREGYACYNPSTGCALRGMTQPLTAYGHGLGCAIIGGYVYRGPIAVLRGAYLFADECSGRIWSVVANGAARQAPLLMLESGVNITSFGESEGGALYATATDGKVYLVTAR